MKLSQAENLKFGDIVLYRGEEMTVLDKYRTYDGFVTSKQIEELVKKKKYTYTVKLIPISGEEAIRVSHKKITEVV